MNIDFVEQYGKKHSFRRRIRLPKFCPIYSVQDRCVRMAYIDLKEGIKDVSYEKIQQITISIQVSLFCWKSWPDYENKTEPWGILQFAYTFIIRQNKTNKKNPYNWPNLIRITSETDLLSVHIRMIYGTHNCIFCFLLLHNITINKPRADVDRC